MDDFNALPDLVIRGILPHLVVEQEWMPRHAKKYKENFYFLHVSSRWRRLGVPLVYKTAFVGLDYLNEWASNIDLILELNMGHLVKRMGIYSENEVSNTFLDLVVPLYDLFNLAIVSNIQLSKKRQTNMTNLVQCLATRFPHISAIDVSMGLTHSYAIEFTNQLLTTFSDRLASLYLDVNTPVDLEYFPALLRHLKVNINRFTGHPLPKIHNPSNLRSLKLYEVPYNFNWKDLVSVSSEFTNLRSLYLDLSGCKYDRETTEAVSYNHNHSPSLQRVQLSFPQLTDLFILKGWESYYFKFDPVHIPSRLNKVHLVISPKELNEFCDLPIKYIRDVLFRMVWTSADLTDVFYSSTNRLLGKMGNSGGTTTVKLYDLYEFMDLNLDVEKVEWYNITTLDIACLSTSTFISLLAKLPRATFVKVGILSYGSYKSVGYQHISQVEEIKIVKFRPGWPVHKEAEFVADILKQHNHVKSLLLPKHTVERMEKMIDKSASTYPHWKHITVSTAKR